MNAIVFLGVMLVLVWLLLIMPQRRRQQAQRRARETVNPGDVILTAGGIYATVREVREHDLTVEIAPELTVRLDKRAIAVMVEEAATEDAEEAGEEPLALEPAYAEATDEAAADEEPTRAART